ncbi:YciI family protein [Streptomyces sp. NPDC056716]|uniref:YciI family protein n=1 Tax=unclassified Streptomyces TaxID=2593676 RepID=UPI0036C2FC83
MKWFLVVRPFTVSIEEYWPELDEHLVWMKQQHDLGNIVLSGPDSTRLVGLYLIRARSLEAAEAIAASDPFTLSGKARYEITEWEIHQAFGVGAFAASGIPPIDTHA